MILYGWNNYRLTTVQPQELGIQNNADLSIEYRQKYFHLFFIPVFPLGKFWAIKQGGKLYEPNAQLKERLVAMQQPVKNGIWAWTGLLLAAAAMFIYNITEKIDHAASQQKASANAAVLSGFFKNEKNTTPLSSKMHAINYFADSCGNDDAYEQKKLDTSIGGMLKLYLAVHKTQQDSLAGYNRKNTLVFSFINHRKEGSLFSDENIRKALEEGDWKGYGDTARVFAALQQLRDYKYLLVIKEYNRLRPTVQQKGFSSGISVADAAIINLENRSVEHKFKVVAANSDSVSHFSYGTRTNGDNMSAGEWVGLLENNLNGNLVNKAPKYVFREEALAIGPRRY